MYIRSLHVFVFHYASREARRESNAGKIPETALDWLILPETTLWVDYVIDTYRCFSCHTSDQLSRSNVSVLRLKSRYVSEVV